MPKLNDGFYPILRFVWRSLAAVTLGLSSVSCSKLDGMIGSSSSGSIQGTVSNLSSLSVSASSCSNVARLYRLSSTGSKILPEIASATVDPSGRYTLNVVGQDLTLTGPNADSFVVEVTGCAQTNSRVVTGQTGQDISVGTSLVTWVQQTPYASTLLTADKTEMNGLLSLLQSVDTYSGAYALLTGNATVSSKFSRLFGMAPTGLLDAAPSITATSIPTVMHEGVATSLTATAKHWSPTYSQFYLWKIGSTVINSGLDVNNVTYTPTANSQGSRTITLYVGQDDGTSNLDLTKSFTSESFDITVANDLPAVPPGLSLVGSDHVNSASINLAMNTGASRINCASFSKLALTEDQIIAPILASDYTLTCATAGTQTISHTLSSEGTKTLRLWAMDSSGNISSGNSSVTVYYSTAAPSLTFASPAAGSFKKSSVLITGACETGSGDVTVSGDVLSSSALTCSAGGVYSGTVNLTNGEGAKSVTISQTNAYGNTGTTSLALVRDDTAPALVITSPSGGVTSSAAVTVTGTCESGAGSSATLVFSGDVVGSPVTRSTSCSSGNFSEILILSSGDGAKSITVSQTDQAGNTGTASASVTLDQSGPVITLTSVPSSAQKGGGTFAVQFQVTEAHITASQSFTVESSTDNGSTWTSGGTVTSTAGPLSAAVFSQTITWPSTTSTQAKVRVRGSDQYGNAGASSSSAAFSIDSTAPTISGFTLAGGATAVALPTVAVVLSASDVGSSVSQMQLSETNSVNPANWVSYAVNSSFNLSQTNGSKTVYAWVKDAAGNISAASSYSLALDFGSPPTLSVTAPSANSTYAVGAAVPITWSCTGSNGLDSTYPIPSIQYTADDSATFCPVTTNISTASGSYGGWTMPATDCNGVSTTNKGIKFVVTCKSAAGVVSTAYSQPINTGGWSVFAGDPWYGLKNVNAAIAQISPGASFSTGSAASDYAGHIYYSYNNAIMKVDSVTGTVTQYAGSLTSSGCTLGTGPALLSGTMSTPRILGMTSDWKTLLVFNCSKVIGINTQTGTASAWTTIGTFSSYTFTKDRWLVYTDGNVQTTVSPKVWKVDLSTAGNSPIWIVGSTAACGSVATAGTDAKSSTLPCGTTSSVVPLVFANRDASKVWVSVYTGPNAARFEDLSGTGTYTVGSTDTGWRSHNSYCVGTDFDNYLYCRNWSSGRQINVFDPSAGNWVTGGQIPFDNNDDSGNLGVGVGATKLFTTYSLNALHSIVPNIGGTWTYTTIGGQPLSTMGNNGPISGVGFSQPIDIRYNAATQSLWVRNILGHLRRIDFANSYNTTTFMTPTSYSGGAASLPVLALNLAGTYTAAMGYWSGWTGIDRFNLSTSLSAATIQSHYFMFRGAALSNSYPPASGTNVQTDAGTIKTANFNSTTGQNILLHSSGTLYMAGKNGTSDIFIFSSNGSVINRVAGITGIGGYVAADSGHLATTVSLTDVQHFQEIDSGTYAGDILFWDGDWMRRLSISTEAASPRVYDIYKLTIATSNYTAGTIFRDIYYDSSTESSGTLGTGTIYYVDNSNGVHKFVPNAALTSATDTPYVFNGLSMSTAGIVRITKTPAGLLVLQPNKSRILRVAP